MTGALDYAYARLPVPLQNAACWVYGKREVRARIGKAFEQRLAQLMESERWSSADIAAYQDYRLRALVRSAYEDVPHYREMMKRLRLVPDDVRRRADLVKLPILTKEDVRQHGDKLLSRRANKRALVHRHTSGTTGKALHFYASKSSVPFQWAIWWRHRTRFGLDVEMLHANFTGKRVVPLNQNRPPYWRWSRPMHQAILNMHHMTPAKIADVVRFLNAHDFAYYSGYPSILHALATVALEAGEVLASRPRIVTTGAENVLDAQRRDIRAFTGAVLTDQYGFSEGCGNASQCEHLAYHEDFEFGIMECVDPTPADHGRTRGKIVCTGFASPEFPFIRYEVGDIGLWADPAKRCACGRASTVLSSVEGRMDDYVITPEGGRIMRFDYVFKDTTSVKETQIVQARLGEITVRIVRRPEYDARDEANIAREIEQWISPSLRVVFEYVNEIQRDASGKFRAVVSTLK